MDKKMVKTEQDYNGSDFRLILELKEKLDQLCREQIRLRQERDALAERIRELEQEVAEKRAQIEDSIHSH